MWAAGKTGRKSANDIPSKWPLKAKNRNFDDIVVLLDSNSSIFSLCYVKRVFMKTHYKYV